MGRTVIPTLFLTTVLLGCWASEVPVAAPSIAQMASELTINNQEEQLAGPALKEWVIDNEGPEAQEERSGSTLVVLQPSVDIKKLLEDILIDDGHDEESHQDSTMMMGGSSGVRDGHGDTRCNCCGAGLRGTTTIKKGSGSISQLVPDVAVQGQGKRQPEFNVLIKTITDRFCAEMRQLGLDPMPVTLRRRTVQETANLIHQRTSHSDRNGRSHMASSAVRVKATMSGLTTLRPVGDVRAFSLPQGKTLLKVNTLTGPVQIATEEQVTTVDELNGEMSFVLHPRGGGVTLHSFRFDKPSNELRSAPSDLEALRSAPVATVGQHLLMEADQQSASASGTEAAVTRFLRRALRFVLNTAR